VSGETCTTFIVVEYGEEWSPCRCPACKAFLPRDFPLGAQFQCRRCGAVLETLPSPTEDPDDPEDIDYEFGGRICVVPKDCITIEVEPITRLAQPRRHATNKVAVTLLGFERRVWVDSDGEFIKINGVRINLGDPLISEVFEGDLHVK